METNTDFQKMRLKRILQDTGNRVGEEKEK